MKLTCVVIVAVLFLTACQLITADDSRRTQKHRALRSTTKLSMLTRQCTPHGGSCGLVSTCCGRCNVPRNKCE
uniref:Conotoxin superfamily O1 n=1 Tax=Conus ermineus TaxID=55423 RepID=A0A346CIR8_CONER|nr:conotoxin precursor superfamily O1 [Conus ermineus]